MLGVDSGEYLDPLLLATALENVGDGVIAVDDRGRVLWLNPVAEGLTRWSRSEARGRPLAEVFRVVDEHSGATAEDPASVALTTGRDVGVASHRLAGDRAGGPITIEDAAVPIRDGAGRVAGAVLVFRDITGRRRAELDVERLAAIVESSDDIIVSKDLDGVITSWNRGAERILGYTAGEVIGKHISVIMPPELIEDMPRILGHVRRGEKVDHYRTKRRRKDGAIIDVSLTVSPIRDATGRIVGASKVGRDVTDEMRSAVLRERLAAIVESSDDIIVSKDLDGVITSWNRGAERILGYTADEVIGKHVSILMPPELFEDTERILGRIRRGEHVDHYRTKRRRKDGAIIDVSLTVSPIRDAAGNVVGASKVGRDVTTEILIEEERREAERRKDEFLAMLAHELRNPLASISSAAQLLGRLETEEDLEWAREVVRRQVHHLARLIDDLLDVSRITRGKISLQVESVDLSPIVASAIEAVRPLIEERKHALDVSLAPGPLRLKADPVRLEQILVNLLTNAAKYTDAGGRIGLNLASTGDHVVIAVRDNGIGMTPELLRDAFDIFVQGDRSAARSEGGLGIGLTLVRKIAELHGGEVTATSAGPGRGSEFTVRLPAPAEPAPAPRPTLRLPEAPPRAARVLVVDDMRDTARALAKVLRLLGHDVQVAHDGPGALRAARVHRPEVVLLDIGLPGMDGYEVARRLRQEDCCRGAKIVAVSGYGQDEDRRRSRDAGFDDHLVKPVDQHTLATLLSLPMN